jgi:hypothetical protein
MAGKKAVTVSKVDPIIYANFFKQLKLRLPPGIGMAEELADLLEISLDAAYRRIRGETEVTFSDLVRITAKHHISMDEVMERKGSTASFTYTNLTDNEDNFVSYLTRLHTQLTIINTFADRKIFYIADEVPIFYSFGYRKLTEFKLFYWQKSVLNIPKYQNEKFRWGIIPTELVDIAIKSHQEYMRIPSSEVWTEETVLTNIKQVKFYFDSGNITKDMALELLQEHRQMIEQVYRMAENGRKNISDQQENFVIYSSEVVLGTNCVYVQMGDVKYSYISFNSINSLTTTNTEFCGETENWLRNLEKKSTLISGTGDKQRYQFFNNMFKTIDTAIDTVTKM